jgi:hypothetical protein
VEAFLVPMKAYKFISAVRHKIFRGAIIQGASFVSSKDGRFFIVYHKANMVTLTI